MPARPGQGEGLVRRAVRGDDHGAGLHALDLTLDAHAVFAEGLVDGGVVRELSQHRDLLGSCVFQGGLNGVADSEAHSQVSGF